MDRIHSLIPLTEQEEQVEGILQHGITHLTHAVFPVRNRMYVCDFFLSNQRTILECWRNTSRRGVALVWIEKNAAYVDLKFKRIKGAYPEVRCIALVEVVHAEPSLVREYAGAAMEHVDRLCCSIDELAGVVREWLGSGAGCSVRSASGLRREHMAESVDLVCVWNHHKRSAA